MISSIYTLDLTIYDNKIKFLKYCKARMGITNWKALLFDFMLIGNSFETAVELAHDYLLLITEREFKNQFMMTLREKSRRGYYLVELNKHKEADKSNFYIV